MRYFFLFLSTSFIYCYVFCKEECKKKKKSKSEEIKKESSYFLVSALISWPQPDLYRKEMNDLDQSL